MQKFPTEIQATILQNLTTLDDIIKYAHTSKRGRSVVYDSITTIDDPQNGFNRIFKTSAELETM